MTKDTSRETKKYRLRDRPRNYRGFALVVALGLMSFLLLLLVTLGTFVRIESQRGKGELNQVLARQNALLGLKLAIAQIQSEAGPDQIATARADILAGPQLSSVETINPGKLFWTGVWSTESADAPVRWLVSGSPDGATSLQNELISPATLASSGAILDSDGGQMHFDIAAPRVSIGGRGDSRPGHFAYWVADESVKARVNLRALALPENTGDTGGNDDRSAVITPARSGVERTTGLEVLAPADIDLLGRVTQVSQLSEIPSVSAVQSDPELATDLSQALKQRHHDLTPFSLGVIANSRDGGLRRDLSQMLEVGGDFSFGGHDTLYPGGDRWRLLRDYYQNVRLTAGSRYTRINPDNGNRIEFWPTAHTTRINGQHGVFPLLVQWDLGIGFIRSPDDSTRAAITLQPVIAVANPYDVPLAEARYVVCSTSTGGIDATRSWWREVDELGNETIVNGSDGASVPRRNIVLQVLIEGEPVLRRQNPGYEGHPDWEWTNRLALQTLLPDFQHDAYNDDRVYNAYNNLRFSFTSGFEPGEIKWFSLPSTVRYTNWPIVELEQGLHIEHYAWHQPQAGIAAIPDLVLPDGVDNPLIEISPNFPGQLNLGLYLYGDAPPQSEFSSDWLTWAQSNGDGSRVNSSGNLPEESLLHTIHAMRPSPRYSSTAVPLSEASINMITHVARIRGSTETRGPLAAAQIGSRGLAHYNFRASRNSAFPLELYHWNSPAYYIAFHNDSQFQESEIWEPDAFDPESFAYSLLLFHIPRQPIQSIAMLQHANLSGRYDNIWTPTYQVGTSLANPHLPPEAVTAEIDGRTIIDHPFMLNETLWDRYFFSASEPGDSGERRLTNPRIIIRQDFEAEVLASAFANSFAPATALMINGPFNINSTSVEAWKAVLSGLSAIEFEFSDIYSGTRERTIQNAIFRTPFPAGGSDTNDPGIFWRGFRELSDPQVTALAEQIVEQVRLRGPFKSIAEFVNRLPSVDNVELARSGALHSALETLGDQLAETSPINPPPDIDQIIPEDADLSDFAFPEVVPGHRGAGAPGWVTQADILSHIGSFITSRSDTFVIRAYGDIGESSSPAADRTTSRAWCEAVVQRIPDYFDTVNGPIESIHAGDSLTPLNERFGRRFRLVAFRWLTEDEI